MSGRWYGLLISPDHGMHERGLWLCMFLRNITGYWVLCHYQIAVDNNDAQMCDFIESEFLNEQVHFIMRIALAYLKFSLFCNASISLMVEQVDLCRWKQ
jgi:hypothetical protein